MSSSWIFAAVPMISRIHAATADTDSRLNDSTIQVDSSTGRTKYDTIDKDRQDGIQSVVVSPYGTATAPATAASCAAVADHDDACPKDHGRTSSMLQHEQQKHQQQQQQHSVHLGPSNETSKHQSFFPDCRLYLARSTLALKKSDLSSNIISSSSRHRRLGIYTVQPISRGHPIGASDILIQLIDYPEESPLSSFVSLYSFEASQFGAQYEAKRVASILAGIASVAQSTVMGESNAVPFYARDMDEADVPRTVEPGAGALTHYHNLTFLAAKHLSAGSEIFVGIPYSSSSGGGGGGGVSDSTLEDDSGDNNDDGAETDIVCSTYHQGQISNCSTYQISTLNSSPQRCLHISSSYSQQSSNNKSHNDNDDAPENVQPKRTVCINYANWFDGTNGCREYSLPQNRDWCQIYGSIQFPTSPYKAQQACCVCGGGRKHILRFDVGDYVRLTKLPSSCTSLKVVKVQETLDTTYTLELEKSCGEKMLVRNPWAGGRVETKYEYEAGTRIFIRGDDPAEMVRHVRVELRKCRVNTMEQEFVFVPAVEDDVGDVKSGNVPFIIRHKLSGLDLSLALGASSSSSSSIYIDAVFPKDLFYKSDEYFFLKSSDHGHGNRHQHHHHQYSLLVSGAFGEIEYSEARLMSIFNDPKVEEDPYSMWTFKEIVDPQQHQTIMEQRGAWVDEHAVWLERTTAKLGIDYLQEIAPWHLLDVEREASKNDVKSRFRELSKYFHPDKVVQVEKKEIFEKIFILLQNAYEGLKSTDERQKQRFRSSADSDSQLFAHSRHVVELLPFHWSKIGGGEGGSDGNDFRYVINATSHLNNLTDTEISVNGTSNASEQLWVVFLYSARCSMSRTVVGFIDLAAEHLEKFENIKVGAYGCGLYSDTPVSSHDPLGVTTDPICKQFQRMETPNVHLVVETISGNDLTLEENSKFKYFYSAIPYGNTTEFLPHNFIQFAKNGKRIWDDLHLVKKMTSLDFTDQEFVDKYSVVAFVDGTKSSGGTVDHEVHDAVLYVLPGLARRFSNANVYIGIASCGGHDWDPLDERHVDCSLLDVSWLPDVKIYGMNETEGMSLLRGPFGDRRDVQIAFESMGNTLNVILGQSHDDLIEDYEELKQFQDDEPDEPTFNSEQCQESFVADENALDPSDKTEDNLDELGQSIPKDYSILHLLNSEQDTDSRNDSKPRLEGTSPAKETNAIPKPKLSSGHGRQKLSDSFASRKPLYRGSGKLLGGENIGNAGFAITG